MENRMNRFGPKKGISNSVSALSGYNNSAGLGHGVMSREQFLKGAGFVTGAVAAAGLGWGGIARAQMPPEQVDIYPGDDIKYMIENADDGALVIVHEATYDIGTSNIVIRKNVTIQGSETGQKPLIKGQSNALHIGALSPTNQNVGVFHILAPGKEVKLPTPKGVGFLGSEE